MVALRSGRQDRALLAAVWVLTLAALGVGIAVLNPVLLFWGALGVLGALFLTRIHIRDTRPGSAAGTAGEPAAGESEAGESEAEKESNR